MVPQMPEPFEQLDYIYMPSRDVPADTRHFTEVLGAEMVFAIDGMGARVAMLALSDSPPFLLLADHVEGETPILVYRVGDLRAAIKSLEERMSIPRLCISSRMRSWGRCPRVEHMSSTIVTW